MIVDVQNGMLHCSKYTEWLRLVKHIFAFKKQPGEFLTFESYESDFMHITCFIVKESGEKSTLGSFVHDDDYGGYVYCMHLELVKTDPYDDTDEKEWRKDFLTNFTVQY